MAGKSAAIRSAHGGASATRTSAPEWLMNAFVPGYAIDFSMSSTSSAPVSATMSAMSMVPTQPWTVTALPVPPRRSASGAHGDRSSHSPTTMPATRPGWPNTLFDETPTTWPATLRMTRRNARPIDGPGPASPPKQPAAYGMASSWRAGPFTNRPGTTELVVVLSENRSKAGSAQASTAAHKRGIAVAGAPAMTALIATFSTVQRPLRGGSSASRSSGKRFDAATYSRTNSSTGGTSGSPSPHPASVANLVNATTSMSVSMRGLVSQSIWHPEGPQERSIVLSANLTHLRLGPGVERVGEHEHAQRRVSGVRGHRVGQRLELLRYDGDRRLASGGHGQGVVDRPRGARSSVAEPDDGDVDLVDEALELRASALAFFADAVPRAPRLHLCPCFAQHCRPLVDHPLERPPRAVVAEADELPCECPGIRPGIGAHLRGWRRRVEDLHADHANLLDRSSEHTLAWSWRIWRSRRSTTHHSSNRTPTCSHRSQPPPTPGIGW